ncbi:hypothetical protein FXO38_33104 [Capsicum annuum]|nr:hypothetical protein FXO38_33104 [Capsicum annuum]
MLFTDDYYDYVGTFEYWWTRGLILDSTYKLPNKAYDSRSSKHPFADCTKALLLPDHEQGNTDPYNILLILGPEFLKDKKMERYGYVKDIGSENFGVARLMRHKETKVLVAMKYIERGHKVVSTPTHLPIVMEYAAGGELFERICNAGRFSDYGEVTGSSFGNNLWQKCKSSLLHSRPKSTAGTPAQIAPKVLSRRKYDGKQTKERENIETFHMSSIGWIRRNKRP